MLQVPGEWISDRFFDRIVADLQRVPLIPTHQLTTYVQSFPYLGSRRSDHAKRQARGKSWPLTAMQQKIVQGLADGKYPKEIAVELGASHPAVVASMARARARSGCETTEELVAKAVAANIVGVRNPLQAVNTPTRLVVKIAGREFAAEPVEAPVPENLAKDIGQRLQRARQEAGLTQKEAADDLRLTSGRLGHIEGGFTMPTLQQLVDLSAKYGKSPREMLPNLGIEGKTTQPRDARAFVDHLSDIELELLQGLAEGKSYPEIAMKRGVSLETIKGQMKQMREKLGANTAARAVALAYRNGALR